MDRSLFGNGLNGRDSTFDYRPQNEGGIEDRSYDSRDRCGKEPMWYFVTARSRFSFDWAFKISSARWLVCYT
jgi:hypothetical protein